MSYPQQPGNWSDPSSSTEQPTSYQPGYPDPAGYQDPAYVLTGEPVGKAGYPPPAYPPMGYPGYGYPVPAAPTNGLSIASMVVSIIGIVGLCGYGLGGYIGVVGAILGHVSRRQIRGRQESGQPESGEGMALAGIIMGWIATAIAVLATLAFVFFFVWLASQDPSTFDNEY